MHITQLKIENIREIENLDISLDYDFLQIKGDNMIGKTSMFYAIQFAFLGVSGTDVTGNDLFRTGTSNSLVELAFTHDDKHYTIVRTRRTASLIDGDNNVLAEGITDTSQAIQRLSNFNGTPEMFITASSVVDMINPATLEDDSIGLSSFIDFNNALSSMSEEVKTLKGDLESMNKYEVVTPEKLAELRKDYEEKQEVVLALKNLIDSSNIELNNLRKVTQLEERLAQPSERDEVTEAYIAETQDALDYYNAYLKSQNVLGTHPVYIPEDFLVKASAYDFAVTANKKREEARRKLQDWDGVPVTDDSVDKLSKEVDKNVNERLAHKQWSEDQPIEPRVSESVEELNEIYENYLAVENAKDELEKGVCNACGTVLNPDQVTAAEKLIKQTELPSWASAAARYAKDRELFDNYPPEPSYDSQAHTKALAVFKEAIELKERIDNYGEDYHKAILETGEAPDEAISRILPRNCDRQFIQEYNLERTKALAVEKVDRISTSTVEALKIKRQRWLDEQDTNQFLRNEIKELRTHLSVRDVKDLNKIIEESTDQLAEMVLDFPQYEKEHNFKIEENERYVATASRVVELTQVIALLRKAIKTMRTRIWAQILQGASEFCATVTDGRIDTLSRDDKGFTYMEGGHIRSVKAGSGLQQTLIGLALRITKKRLQSDPYPLLLDEVTARIKTTYMAKFIHQLNQQPYQKFLISQTTDGDQYLDTLSFSDHLEIN